MVVGDVVVVVVVVVVVGHLVLLAGQMIHSQRVPDAVVPHFDYKAHLSFLQHLRRLQQLRLLMVTDATSTATYASEVPFLGLQVRGTPLADTIQYAACKLMKPVTQLRPDS